MAENKKALIRYLVYDNCLNNKRRKYTYKDLIHQVNEALQQHDLKPIGKSQFYQDMQFMRHGHWKAPIDTYNVGRNKYYTYTEDFSLKGTFSKVDSMALVIELSPFKNMPWYNKLLLLNQELNLEKNNIIGFDFNALYKGQELLEVILPAILNQEILNIQYKKGEYSSIEPYYIKMYNNRFYLLAKLTNKDTIYTFSLHNITHIENSGIFFVLNKQVQWNKYFQNTIGISLIENEHIEDVMLLMSLEDLEYFKTKPIHTSQNYFLVEGDMAIVNIKVTCNIFLENLLLSYCDRIEILKPSHLRERIIYRLSQALSLYNE